MKISRRSAAFVTSIGMFFAVSATGGNCWAVFVYFDGSTSSDFQVATNWTPENAPGTNLVDVYGIDDGRSSTFSGGATTVNGLRVGSVAKEHAIGEQHFGRLTMAGGSLEVIGNNALSVGRENLAFYDLPAGADYNVDTVVDAADYVIWRNTLGSSSDLSADGDSSGTIDAPDYSLWRAGYGNRVHGGEIIMTGNSTLKAYGALIGDRTKGLLSIGPNAAVDIRIWDTTVTPNQFGGTENMWIGTWGPAYNPFGGEPGLKGDGLVDVRGTLNAKDLYVTEHGGKGEIRLTGSGTVNLNGRLIMDVCAVCESDPNLLAMRSSKVSVIGSGGMFNVGLDPDTLVVDPSPPPRDLRANSPTATISFTADAGGVTPITVVENPGERSGTAYINGANLQLNLDAYTSSSPLTLIDAPSGMIVDPAPADPAPHFHLVGSFGANVTFLGIRRADVNYDYANGNVYLNNFRIGPGVGAGSLASSAVPEPSSLALMPLTLCLLLFVNYRIDRRTARCWEYQCQRVRA